MNTKRKLVRTLLSYEWRVTSSGAYGIFGVSEVAAGPFTITVQRTERLSLTGFLVERGGVTLKIKSFRIKRRVLHIERKLSLVWMKEHKRAMRMESRARREADQARLDSFASMG